MQEWVSRNRFHRVGGKWLRFVLIGCLLGLVPLSTRADLFYKVEKAVQASDLSSLADQSVPMVVTGLNNSGRTVGFYALFNHPAGHPPEHDLHAFVYDHATQTLTDINAALPSANAASSMALCVNASGVVAGICWSPLNANITQVGFTWQNGVGTTFTSPEGLDIYSVTGINSLGHVIGTYFATYDSNLRGFFYDGTTCTDLGDLGDSANPCIWPLAINDADQIVGTSYQTEVSPPIPTAFVWQDSVLGPLEGTDAYQKTQALGINNAGAIIGTYGNVWNGHSFRSMAGGFYLADGAATGLGDLGGGGTVPFALGTTGQAYGTSYASDHTLHLFGWNAGAIADLGAANLHATDLDYQLTSVNASGSIAGFIHDANNQIQAALRTGALEYQLTSLLPAYLAFTQMSSAYGSQVLINDAGMIACAGTSASGQQLALLLSVDPDTDNDGLPDSWEMQYYGHLGVDKFALAAGGGGLTNLQAYQQGTDPNDFYNGKLPGLVLAYGGDQRGDPGTVLPLPVTVLVTADPQGDGLLDAPVTFTVTSGGALLAASADGSGPEPSTSVQVRTSDLPFAEVYVYLPAGINDVSVITASVTTGGQTVSVATTATSDDPKLPPPSDLSAVSLSSTAVQLTWTPGDPAYATTVQISLDGGVTWRTLGTVAAGVQHVTVTGLPSHSSASFRLLTVSGNAGTPADPGGDGVTTTLALPSDPNTLPTGGGAGSAATGAVAVQTLTSVRVKTEVQRAQLSWPVGPYGFASHTSTDNCYLTRNVTYQETYPLAAWNYTKSFTATIDPVTGQVTGNSNVDPLSAQSNLPNYSYSQVLYWNPLNNDFTQYEGDQVSRTNEQYTHKHTFHVDAVYDQDGNQIAPAGDASRMFTCTASQVFTLTDLEALAESKTSLGTGPLTGDAYPADDFGGYLFAERAIGGNVIQTSHGLEPGSAFALGRFQWQVDGGSNQTVYWDEAFTPFTNSTDPFTSPWTAPAQHDIHTWQSHGATESPIYVVDPRTRHNGQYGRYDIQYLPVEMKITDRDDPKKKWADNVVKTAPVYSGKSTGDMVSWKIGGTDSWTNATFSWSAEGPENKTGPSGTGKNEWKIADGDEDTDHDWIDWKPGKYNIKCTISFGDGRSSTIEFEQEVGVRTEEYFVVGTIPTEPISTTGVDPRIIQQWACAPGESGVYMIYYAILYLMGGGTNNTSSPFFIPFDEANRVYVNNRLFNASRNLDPAPAIKPEEPVTKACGLDPIKHYRGFSACQFKFLTKDGKLNSSPQLIAGHYTDLVGLTPLLCQSENYAGVKGESHGDSGKATGAIGDAEVTYLSKFRVGKDGQKGFSTLNGRNIPWVFFRFRFEAKDDGLIDTKFDAGASDDPNGPDTKDFSKVPTWLVYRRYYDLSTNTWKIEQIRKIDELRRPFFSIGTQIPGAAYTLP